MQHAPPSSASVFEVKFRNYHNASKQAALEPLQVRLEGVTGVHLDRN